MSLIALGLGGSLLVESAALLLRWAPEGWVRSALGANDHPRIYLIARAVAITSIVADLVGAAAGRGTVFTQLSGAMPESPLANATSLVSGWSELAVALLIASYLGNKASRRRIFVWLLALIVTQVVLVGITAISSPLFGFVTLVAALGAISGVIRARYVAVTAIVLVLAWPSLFQIRNEVRQNGGFTVSQEITAEDRLRFDLQMSAAAHHDVPAEVRQPSPLDYIRYGLVPRVLDPERPVLSTGREINQYLGGVATSAYSFMTLGNVYFLDGRRAVVIYYALWSAVVMMLLRLGGGPGPVRLALLCFVLSGPLLWSSAYPDSTIALMQHTVAALPIFVLLWLTRRRATVCVSRGGRPHRHVARHRNDAFVPSPGLPRRDRAWRQHP
ncbi:hypothetical protein [Micromonospora sp. DH14]|uniref:hypothetical protein n=1 Tax=Micromonospora sp. DH14 TaxID=3040120 RepID=UPI002441D004|nr:hypothetical protein [Micromonospora sp. DH14]MDG9675551.1 hypothetical protein [Micromonospora sp. DH14]